MSRIRISLPDFFPFSTRLRIRVSDLNYGGHVGNDRILTLAHEARVRYLASIGKAELAGNGTGLIMSDAGLEFKAELHLGDEVEVSVAAANISRASFDLYYKFEKLAQDSRVPVAFIKTAMVFFDYTGKKVMALPEDWKKLLSGNPEAI